MATDYPATLLGLTHFAVGVTSLISPPFISKLALLSYHPSSSFIARLFGAREFIVGFSILRSIVGSPQRTWAMELANIVNLIDVVSAVVEFVKSDYRDQGAAFGGVGAASLLGLGMWSLGGFVARR